MSQFWIYGSAGSKGLHITEVIMSFMSDKTESMSVIFCKNAVVSSLFKFQFG